MSLSGDMPAAFLVDIEGTTSSIGYVYDVLFPYARTNLVRFLESKWDAAETIEACTLIATDAGAKSLNDWWGTESSAEQRRAKVCSEVIKLMDSDAKVTGLKTLQGLIWREGYEQGQLKSQVFPDVPPALAAWRDAGIDVCIYSSGSIQAQKLFFGHTEFGDLSVLLNGFYDTTYGGKREPESYTRIAGAMGRNADEVLFLSDVKAELDAARQAGMRTLLVVRPGNAQIENPSHHSITSFAEI